LVCATLDAGSATTAQDHASTIPGVHQDGLVHISAMSEAFVKDPREVVKAGDIVKVKVMAVDEARQRISLSMGLDDQPGEKPGRRNESRGTKQPRGGKGKGGPQ